MHIINGYDSSKFKNCSLLQPLCNLKVNCYAITNFSYTHRCTTFWRYRVISRLFIPFALFLFVSCSPKEVTIAFLDIDDSFSLSSNTRLIIKLGDPHPNHLLIYSPKRYVYYFLKTKGESDELIFKKELVLDPLTFKGIRYDENTGEQIEEIVFTTPGKYRLYFTNNTETEPGNTFSLERSITFK